MLVNLQPGHLVGISDNVIWVTVSKGPCVEHIHQFQMFAILKYVHGQTGHKAQNFSPVARQPALT